MAHTVLGHPQPFFAPIAALAALAVNVGERGQRATGMVVGVGVGVLVAEVALYVAAASPLTVGLVVLTAMLVTRALTSSIIGVVQGGASAVFVLALQGGTPGSERLLDALVGGGAGGEPGPLRPEPSGAARAEPTP